MKLRILGLFVILAMVVSACAQSNRVDSTPPSAPPTSTAAPTTTSPHRPLAYGEDAELDQLWDQCVAEDFVSCDLLVARSVSGSDYEQFGVTCGERNEPLTEQLCADVHAPLGTVEVAEGAPIRIAALQHQDSGAGSDELRGVELAIDDFGSILDRDIELVFEDSGCDLERGASSAVAVASQPDVLGVVGPTCSAAAKSATEIISEGGMVMISGSASNPVLTSDLAGTAGAHWYPGFYRTFYNDIRFSLAAAVFMGSQLGLGNVAVVAVNDDDYHTALAMGFEREFTVGGGVSQLFEVDGSATDLRPLLTDIERMAPDGIFITGPSLFLELFVQQVADSELIGELPVVVGQPSEELFRQPEAVGIYGVVAPFDFDSNEGFNGVTLDGLSSAFRSRYGEAPTAPDPLYPYSYDATIMLLTAIQSVAAQQGDLVIIDRDDLREELGATTRLAGVTGLITCDEFGDCGPEELEVVENTRPDKPSLGLANVIWSYPDRS